MVTELPFLTDYKRAKRFEKQYSELFSTQAVSIYYDNGKMQALVYTKLWLNHTKRKVLYIPCAIEGEKIYISKQI